MIRILLLDDHAVVRAGYRQLIDAEADMQVAAEASTSAQACELIRQQEIDVAVVDLSLKGDSGLEAIRRLRERQPDLKVLIFTMHAQESYALQALRAGALGYLTKDSDPEDMLDALRQVARGRRVFSGEIAQALLSDVARAGQGDLLDRLTPREFDVLRLVTSGETIGEIAQALHISEKTVFNTMSLVRQKLEERSDFRLCRLVLEQGVVRL